MSSFVCRCSAHLLSPFFFFVFLVAFSFFFSGIVVVHVVGSPLFFFLLLSSSTLRSAYREATAVCECLLCVFFVCMTVCGGICRLFFFCLLFFALSLQLSSFVFLEGRRKKRKMKRQRSVILLLLLLFVLFSSASFA